MIRILLVILAILVSLPAAAQYTLSGNTSGRPPSNSSGKEADWFLDPSTGSVFGPKTSGVWPNSSTKLISNTAADCDVTLYPSGGDDTAALQTAINGIGAASVTICFQRGVFNFGGPLLDPSTYNSQIEIPAISIIHSQRTLTLIGYNSTPTTFDINNLIPPMDATTGTVLNTTLTGQTGGSFIAAKFATRDNVHVVMKNLTIQAPPNPTISGLDLRNVDDAELYNIFVYTGNMGMAAWVQPTHSWATGVMLPQYANAANTITNRVLTVNFYNGFMSGELLYGDLEAAGNICAVSVMAAGHANLYTKLGDYQNQNGLCVQNVTDPAGKTTVFMDILQHDIEVYNGTGGAPWMTRVYDIDDSHSNWFGTERWYSPTFTGLTNNVAGNVSISNIGDGGEWFMNYKFDIGFATHNVAIDTFSSSLNYFTMLAQAAKAYEFGLGANDTAGTHLLGVIAGFNRSSALTDTRNVAIAFMDDGGTAQGRIDFSTRNAAGAFAARGGFDNAGDFYVTKLTQTNTAVGAGKLKLEVVAGTNAGTCKLIAYAGTSTTPETILDNIGGGC